MCVDDKYRVKLQPKLGSMDPADYINASHLDVSMHAQTNYRILNAQHKHTLIDAFACTRGIDSVSSTYWLKDLWLTRWMTSGG